jgi:hypothetical protein
MLVDPLTGWPNQDALRSRIAQAMTAEPVGERRPTGAIHARPDAAGHGSQP